MPGHAGEDWDHPPLNHPRLFTPARAASATPGNWRVNNFSRPVPDLLNRKLWNPGLASSFNSASDARSTLRTSGRVPLSRRPRRRLGVLLRTSTGAPPRSTLPSEFTAGSALGLASDRRMAGEGRRGSRWAAPLQTHSLYRVGRGSPESRLTPLKLPLTWSLGEMQPTSQTAPSSAQVSNPSPRRTGPLAQNRGRSNEARRDAPKQRKAVSVQRAPPRLDASIPSPGQHAGRQKERPALTG